MHTMLSSIIFSVNMTSLLLLVAMVRVYCKEAITDIQLTTVTVLVTTSLTSLSYYYIIIAIAIAN